MRERKGEIVEISPLLLVKFNNIIKPIFMLLMPVNMLKINRLIYGSELKVNELSN
nr:MAG TPA: hypothetical protein [Caudoviricetes sp.]